MFEREWRLAGCDIPDLDCKVAGRGGKDILGRGVEQDLSDLSALGVSNSTCQNRRGRNLPRVTAKLAHGGHIRRLLGVGVESKVVGDLPDKDLAILGSGRNNAIVKRVPGPG